MPMLRSGSINRGPHWTAKSVSTGSREPRGSSDARPRARASEQVALCAQARKRRGPERTYSEPVLLEIDAQDDPVVCLALGVDALV